MVQLLLASQSPRRRELIQLVDLPFSCSTPDVDERSVGDADPAARIMKTSRLKARAMLDSMARRPERRTIIVAADTAVVCNMRLLGKPADESDARQMLLTLRNQVHHVSTGLTLLDVTSGDEIVDVHTAEVRMRDYSDLEIADYIATGDPMDKAGAYAIQHPVFNPVLALEGCYTGVMGLSVCHLLLLLDGLGVSPNADMGGLLQAHRGFACPLYQQLVELG